MTAGSAPQLEPARQPAALAGAITSAWRPYGWRGYAMLVITAIGVAAFWVATVVLLK